MVLRRKLTGILTILAVTLVFSCEKEPLLIACDDCTTTIPTDAIVRIRINNWPNETVIYNVYLGNLEDNILIKSASTSASETSALLPVNKKYTITVQYSMNDAVYIAVDSVYPRVGFNKEQCDDPCYYVYDRTANLSLKHE
jgi:hypothetical protein